MAARINREGSVEALVKTDVERELQLEYGRMLLYVPLAKHGAEVNAQVRKMKGKTACVVECLSRVRADETCCDEAGNAPKQLLSALGDSLAPAAVEVKRVWVIREGIISHRAEANINGLTYIIMEMDDDCTSQRIVFFLERK